MVPCGLVFMLLEFCSNSVSKSKILINFMSVVFSPVQLGWVVCTSKMASSVIRIIKYMLVLQKHQRRTLSGKPGHVSAGLVFEEERFD